MCVGRGSSRMQTRNKNISSRTVWLIKHYYFPLWFHGALSPAWAGSWVCGGKRGWQGCALRGPQLPLSTSGGRAGLFLQALVPCLEPVLGQPRPDSEPSLLHWCFCKTHKCSSASAPLPLVRGAGRVPKERVGYGVGPHCLASAGTHAAATTILGW